MGIFDKAKDLANEHNAEVDQAVDKMADVVDDKTGHQHTEKIDEAAQQVKDSIDDASGHARG